MPSHRIYVEPFFGGGQVLFHKKPSEIEIVNDLSDDVVTFFRMCQNHHVELIRSLKYMIIGRKWAQLLLNTDPRSLTDIQRAVRFLYLQKTSYGGLVVRRNFTLRIIQAPNFNHDRLADQLEDTWNRLRKVQIESVDYKKIIQKCDKPSTFFYLDPPYWNKKLYHFNFTEQDFIEMEKLLRTLKGKFLLSINDVPEIRALFKNYKIETVKLSYTAQKKAGVRFTELLIRNY